jgi:threonine aldolase
MRFLSAQLDAYLADDLWLRNAAQANRMAQALAGVLRGMPGVRLVQAVQANEVFAAMPDALIAALQDGGAHFYRWIAVPGVSLPVVRFVTAFSTTQEEVDAFAALGRGLARQAA